MYEVKLQFYVFLKLLHQPFIAEIGEQPQRNIYKFSHHRKVLFHILGQMSMLDLHGYFLSIQQLCLVHLRYRCRIHWFFIEALEDNLNRKP